MEKTSNNSASDVEASGEEPVNGSQYVNPREGIKNSQWILTCIALYLGALLYGKGSSDTHSWEYFKY